MPPAAPPPPAFQIIYSPPPPTSSPQPSLAPAVSPVPTNASLDAPTNASELAKVSTSASALLDSASQTEQQHVMVPLWSMLSLVSVFLVTIIMVMWICYRWGGKRTRFDVSKSHGSLDEVELSAQSVLVQCTRPEGGPSMASPVVASPEAMARARSFNRSNTERGCAVHIAATTPGISPPIVPSDGGSGRLSGAMNVGDVRIEGDDEALDASHEQHPRDQSPTQGLISDLRAAATRASDTPPRVTTLEEIGRSITAAPARPRSATPAPTTAPEVLDIAVEGPQVPIASPELVLAQQSPDSDVEAQDSSQGRARDRDRRAARRGLGVGVQAPSTSHDEQQRI